MADDVGTTYFSYRGPSPSHDIGYGSQANRNTIRSLPSVISSRGDNNEITTLALRPYQSNVHDPDTSPTQSILLLAPPYPGYSLPGQPYLAPPYTHLDSLARDTRDLHSNVSLPVHPDFTKGTETLRQCVFMLAIVFLLVFGVAIFMAVYYGHNYSSS